MAGSAAGKSKKRKARKAKGGANYVVRGKGGKLFVAAGKSGDVAALSKKQVEEIEKLIRQRQELGLLLTQLLRDQGYGVSPTYPTIIIEPGDGPV